MLFADDGKMDRVSLVLLSVLAIFSLIAILGYWFFALNPQNLARFPESASFYSVSYRFFAQGQVWLSGLVLAIHLVRQAGFRWILPLVVVYILSLSSELLGTTTGFPFGDYAYTSFLGAKWFDHVPFLIPLSWFTMALPSWIMTGSLIGWESNKVVRWLLTGFLLMVWDLALDPAMSFLVPYWEWGVEGAYYGMPFINLAGWFVTGVVLAAALDWTGLHRWRHMLSVRWLSAYYVVLFMLPVGMLAVAGEWLGVVTSVVVFCATIEAYARMRRPSTGSTQAPPGHAPVLEFPSGRPDPEEMDRALATVADRMWTFFRQHSRSFSFASNLFPRSDKRKVAQLYAFCRVTDDLADRQDLEGPVRRELLNRWREMVLRSFRGTASGIAWLDELMSLLRESGLSESVLSELMNGVESDLGSVRMETMDDLRSYTFRVASTVGIMMCHLFGEATPWKLSRAIALGRAMQMTNIARDVGEDLRMDRIYIPNDMLARHGMGERALRDMLRTGVVLPAWTALMQEFRDAADAEYEHAWSAIPSLAPPFGRAVAVAAVVYRGIHTELERSGWNSLQERVWTAPVQKFRLAVRGLLRYVYLRRRLDHPNEAVSTTSTVPSAPGTRT
jgi:phytoene/squalene synthetase/uncharacterized membrane protein